MSDDMNETIKRLEQIAEGDSCDDGDGEDHAAPTIVCCVCLSKATMEDDSGFSVGHWVVCQNCLHPIMVEYLCAEGHAHTVVYEPDFESAGGRSDALFAVKTAVGFLPGSTLNDAEREEFERTAEEFEKSILGSMN